MEHEIYDARKPTRTHGPYGTAGEAQAAADMLNKYIYENGIGKEVGPAAEIVGPYYVRPVAPKPQRETVVVVVFDGGSDPHLTRAVTCR